MKSILLLIVLLFTLSYAQEEAGEYDRASLTYISHLLQVDPSISKLPEEYNRMLVNKMSKQLKLPRYDQNTMPKSLQKVFAEEVRNTENICAGNRERCLVEVTSLINRVVAPPILDIVAMNKELRSQQRMTEEQRNSFITDKAKELGFTIDEVSRVMNSAYIFLPYASNLEERTWKDTTYVYVTKTVNGKKVTKKTNKIDKITTKFSTAMSMGLVWWKIVPGDSTKESRLVKFQPLTDSSRVYVTLGKKYKLDDKMVNAHLYARTKMIRGLGGSFGERLRAFEDFKLSGQVLERSPNYIGMDIGEREGISTDDVFLFMESIEENGVTTMKRAGWALVRDVADSNSADGYKSTARIVGGRPYIGAVLKEYPMMNAESAIRFQTQIYESSPVVFTDTILNKVLFQDLKIESGMGPRIELGALVGKKNTPQLFAFLGASFSKGKASGKIGEYNSVPVTIGDSVTYSTVFNEYLNVSEVVAGHYDFSILKRFYIKRVALSLQTGGGFQHMNIKLDDGSGMNSNSKLSDKYNYHLETRGWGGFSNVFAEIAVTPGFAFGGGVGYRYFGSNSEFELEKRLKDDSDDDAEWLDIEVLDAPSMNYNGMTWSAYFTFRPSINLR